MTCETSQNSVFYLVIKTKSHTSYADSLEVELVMNPCLRI